MNAINIDKNITPNEKITFQVTMQFFGYAETRQFSFKAPPACPRLSKLNDVYMDKGTPKEVKQAEESASFKAYEKGGSVGNGFYRLKLQMNSAKKAGTFKAGDQVTLSSSDSKLSALNGKKFNVINPPQGSNKPTIIHLKVSNSFVAQGSNNVRVVASGSVSEIAVVKQQKIKITPPESVFKGLIKQVTIGNPKKGEVDDIIIYAYKQFPGNNSAKYPRKLMINDAEIDPETPPSRSTVSDYRKVRSYAKDFLLEEDKRIICYISVARYVYDGTKWVGEWIQKNALNQAIWAKAVPKG